MIDESVVKTTTLLIVFVFCTMSMVIGRVTHYFGDSDVQKTYIKYNCT